MVGWQASLAALLYLLTGTTGAGDVPSDREAPDELRASLPPAGAGLRANPRDGLVLAFPEPGPQFHVGSVLAIDAIDYGAGNRRDSGFFIDRAVLRFDGSYGPLSWRVAPDLKGIDTRGGLDEAWLSFEPAAYFRVTAGLIEIPLSVEHSYPEEDLPFVGYSFPAFIDSRTDLAVRLDGELEEGLFSYGFAATAGEGFDRRGNRSSGPQLSGIGTLYPFRWVDSKLQLGRYEIPVVSGIFVGGGAAFTGGMARKLEVATPLRNTLFRSARFEAEESIFFHVAFGADWGPFLVLHETVKGGFHNVDTPAGSDLDLPQLHSWTLLAAWMATGEPYDSRPFRLRNGRAKPFPRRPLWGSPDEEKGIGAVEVAARYSNADIDRDFFNFGLTDYTLSSQEFRTFSFAVNWYPVSSLRTSFEVVRVLADQDPDDTGSRDTSFLFRVQIDL